MIRVYLRVVEEEDDPRIPQKQAQIQLDELTINEITLWDAYLRCYRELRGK